MLPLILALRVRFEPTSIEGELQEVRFYFRANGTVQASVEGDDIAGLFVCTPSEYSDLFDGKDDACAIGRDGFRVWQSVIERAGRYRILVKAWRSVVIVTLHNPTSFLDGYEEPCLISLPAVSVLFLLLMVLWSVIWLRYASRTVTLHTFVSFTFVAALIYEVVYYFEFRHRDVSDDATPLTEIRITLDFVRQTFFFWTTIMAAKGWSIVQKSLPKREFCMGLTFSAFLTVPITVAEHIEPGIVALVVIGLAVIGMLCYYGHVVRSIRASQRYVIAHLMVISEEGIDPRTTHVWRKFVMFRGILWGLFAFLTIRLAVSAVRKFSDAPFWITLLISDLSVVLLMALAAFLFRLKKETSSGYMMVGDNENGSRQLPRDQVVAFTADGEEDQSLASWREGMTLPPQPVFTDDAREMEEIQEMGQAPKE
jgi:hypothetical protein